MNKKSIKFNDDYMLILLAESHLQTLFNWNIEEKDFEQYTCRPLKLQQSFEEYAYRTLKLIAEEKHKIYIIINKEDFNEPLGRITLSDFNPRNHSAEFGYYIPKYNRKKGLGTVMLSQFTEKIFTDDKLHLNKIYATTSSINLPSIKLLEKFDFKLDGRLREHYWINEDKYDQLNYSLIKCEWSK